MSGHNITSIELKGILLLPNSCQLYTMMGYKQRLHEYKGLSDEQFTRVSEWEDRPLLRSFDHLQITAETVSKVISSSIKHYSFPHFFV